jgi:HEAT repeat protein
MPDDDLDTLMKTFTSDSLFIQMAAASALKSVGEPAVPRVAGVLSHENDTVRASAARLLGEIPITDAALAAETVAALRDALSDPAQVVRWYAAQSIGTLATQHPGMGHTAVKDLIPLLGDDTFPHPSADRAVCEVAASALRAIGTDEAVQAVEEWWNQGDDDWGLE